MMLVAKNIKTGVTHKLVIEKRLQNLTHLWVGEHIGPHTYDKMVITTYENLEQFLKEWEF